MKKILLLIISLILISNISYSYGDFKLYDKIQNINVSDDGNNIIYEGTRDGKSYIVLNGKESQAIDKDRINDFIYSKDLSEYSYIGYIEGEKKFVENGIEKKYCKDYDIWTIKYYDGKVLVKCSDLPTLSLTSSSKKPIYYYAGSKTTKSRYEELLKSSNKYTSNICKYKSGRKDEKGLYSILNDGVVIKTFNNSVSVRCYNNGNSYYYIYKNRPLFKNEYDSKYDNTDNSVIYTLVVDGKEYKTKTNINEIKFYSKGLQTAFVISDIDSEFNKNLYVNGKLIKKIDKNHYFGDFHFSPKGDGYLFTIRSHSFENNDYLYKNGSEIVKNPLLHTKDFKYLKNGSYFYLMDSKLYKNGIKISDEKVIGIRKGNFHNSDLTDYILFELDSKFYISNINNLFIYKNTNSIKNNNEEGLKLIKDKSEKIKKQIYKKYGEDKFKEKISNLYIKNPEKINKIKKNIENKMDRVVENNNLTQNQKINEISKLYAILSIFKESMNETEEASDLLESLMNGNLFN